MIKPSNPLSEGNQACSILVLDEQVIESGECWRGSRGQADGETVFEVGFRFRGREFLARQGNADSYLPLLLECARLMIDAGLIPNVAGLNPDVEFDPSVDILAPAAWISAPLPILIARYPRLFHGALPRGRSFLPAGWFVLVDALCQDIDRILAAHPEGRFEVRQIKEKLGSLRFYWHWAQAGAQDTAALEELRTLIWPLVELVVQKSGWTCEVCGAPLALVRVASLVTRCTRHRLDA